MKKKKTLILIALLLIISIGFALISSNMGIGFLARFAPGNFDIRLDNISRDVASVTFSKDPVINGTTISFPVVLSKPGDIAAFSVDVVNDSKRDAVLSAINKTDLSSYGGVITATVRYDDGNTLLEGDLLKSNSKQELYVEVKYNGDEFVDSDTPVTFEVELEYVPGTEGREKPNIETFTAPIDKTLFRDYFNDHNVSAVKFVTSMPSDFNSSSVNTKKYTKVANGFVYAWMEDTTMYIASYKRNTLVKTLAPVDATKMFYSLPNVKAVDVKYLDTSKTTNMYCMFSLTSGLKGIDKLNLSKATNIYGLLYDSTMFDNDRAVDVSGWDVSHVENMERAFGSYSHEPYLLSGMENWDTHSVTNLNCVFSGYGGNRGDVILDLKNWDVSNVIDFEYAFENVGDMENNTVLIDISGWNLSSATSINSMFSQVGLDASEVTINVTNVNTSTIEEMDWVFSEVGMYNADTVTLTGINAWDFSNCTTMDYMFEEFAQHSSQTWDFSSWNVRSGVSHRDFDGYVEGKIILPNWN